MDARFKMRYDYGTSLHTKGMQLAHNWLPVVEEINRIANKMCRFDSKVGEISYITEERSFTLSYQLCGTTYVLTIKIGDASYVLTIDPSTADHLHDTLEIVGKASLYAVGEDNWYKVVSECLSKILVYVPNG